MEEDWLKCQMSPLNI